MAMYNLRLADFSILSEISEEPGDRKYQGIFSKAASGEIVEC